jgi:hypothetical protein
LNGVPRDFKSRGTGTLGISTEFHRISTEFHRILTEFHGISNPVERGIKKAAEAAFQI